MIFSITILNSNLYKTVILINQFKCLKQILFIIDHIYTVLANTIGDGRIIIFGLGVGAKEIVMDITKFKIIQNNGLYNGEELIGNKDIFISMQIIIIGKNGLVNSNVNCKN